ncbi:hypothetical protein MRX96_019092 [Rhipicephalus microplus]
MATRWCTFRASTCRAAVVLPVTECERPPGGTSLANTCRAAVVLPVTESERPPGGVRSWQVPAEQRWYYQSPSANGHPVVYVPGKYLPSGGGITSHRERTATRWCTFLASTCRAVAVLRVTECERPPGGVRYWQVPTATNRACRLQHAWPWKGGLWGRERFEFSSLQANSNLRQYGSQTSILSRSSSLTANRPLKPRVIPAVSRRLWPTRACWLPHRLPKPANPLVPRLWPLVSSPTRLARAVLARFSGIIVAVQAPMLANHLLRKSPSPSLMISAGCPS